MFETYKPSGRFGILALPLAIVGVVAAALLSCVYHLGLYAIPLIYISFLLTWFFGTGLGMAGSYIVSKGKVRGLPLAILLGVLMTVAAISGKFYCQYQHAIFDTISAIKQSPDAAGLTDAEIRGLVAEEYDFSKHIQARVDRGWEIGRPGRNGGAPIAGPFVYLVWLIELGIIAWSAVGMPIAAAREPYSEKLDEWASEQELVMTLPVTNEEMVRQIESATTVDGLLEIPIPKTDQSDRFAVYRVNSIQGQELEDAYLSVDLLELSLDKEGNQQAKTKSLVQHAVLSAEQRKQLVENASLLKEAMTEYRKAVAEEASAAENSAAFDQEAETAGGT